MPVEISLRDVRKTYPTKRGSVAALDGMNLDISQGEFVAVLGPSGCGKSTMLRLIAGLEEPDSGTVTLGGGTPGEQIRQGALGVAFQDNALLPWLSVRSNIALPYKLHKQPVDSGRVDELLRLIGLEDFADSKPRELSGGMRQRVSIARSLVLHPGILLLDEPFGALDAVTRHQMNVELGQIMAEEKATTFLVTHSVDEAVFLADRVVVMTGRPGQIKTQVPIDLGQQRTRHLMSSPEFQQLVAGLTEALFADDDRVQQ